MSVFGSPLKKLQPDNIGLALAIESEIEFSRGDVEGLTKTLTALSNLSSLEWNTKDLEVCSLNLLRSLKINDPISRRDILSGGNYLSVFHQSITKPALAVWSGLSSEDRIKDCTMYLRLANLFGSESDERAATSVGTQQFMLGILENLDPEVLYGESGITVGEKCADVRARSQKTLKQMSFINENVKIVTDNQWLEYTDRQERWGLGNAQAWLVDQIQTANTN